VSGIFQKKIPLSVPIQKVGPNKKLLQYNQPASTTVGNSGIPTQKGLAGADTLETFWKRKKC